MLNIEVIKFEAQDVITASGVKAPVCTCPVTVYHYDGSVGKYGEYKKINGEWVFVECKCEVCHD